MKVGIKSLIGVFLIGCVFASSAQSVFPTRMDIDVSTKRDTRNIGAGSDGEAKVTMVQCSVKIRKTGGATSEDPFHVELYIIGQQIQTGYYGIMDVVKKTFTFDKEDDNSFHFSTKSYPFGETSGNINVGAKYETYLVVVTDKDGKILETRSGRAISDKGIAFIRDLGPKTLFDRDGNVIGKVENPGSAFRAAIPAAVEGSDE